MRRRTLVIGTAAALVALTAVVAPPVAQFLGPACQNASQQAEAAHAATMAARRRTQGDVPALYADEAAMRGYRAARCGPLGRLFEVPAN